MIEKPKKERRFLKTLGKIGEILIQEVLIKIGSNLIKKIGGKKTLPSILFLLASLSLFAQYPATGNKQRLGYQTSGDGLVFRGRANDTVALKSSTINNAYFILDTVNNVLFNYIKTKGGWVFNNTDTVINNITVDTTSLSNRINLKLNISDTASMLAPYFKDADTTSLNLTSRFATKLNISDTASMLTNYLRSGVAASTYQAKLNGTGFIKASGTNITYDNSTYLTTGTAASTYLPLTGGTLTGALNLSSGILNTWTSAYNSAPRNDGSISRGYFFNLRNSSGNYGNVTRVIHNYMFSQDENSAAPQTFYYGRLNGFYAQDYNAASASIIYDASIYYHNSNQFYYRAFSEPENKVTFSIKPSTTVDVLTGTKADLYLSGDAQIDRSLNIGTTLGVTGATTLSAPLTVNSSAVFNEGSTDSDFRVESDGNANMVFVDASTDRVGIGTNAPDKTLHVNGEVKIATVTATPTSLLGKDGSNVVGEVTTVAQTGLMTRGETTATTGSPSATFTVTHGLGTNPSAIIVTSAGIGGAEKIIYEVYTKSSTTFSVQAWNLDGTEASSKSVKIYWLAIK